MHDFPELVLSDNCPQYLSHKSEQFTKSCSFDIFPAVLNFHWVMASLSKQSQQSNFCSSCPLTGTWLCWSTTQHLCPGVIWFKLSCWWGDIYRHSCHRLMLDCILNGVIFLKLIIFLKFMNLTRSSKRNKDRNMTDGIEFVNCLSSLTSQMLGQMLHSQWQSVSVHWCKHLYTCSLLGSETRHWNTKWRTLGDTSGVFWGSCNLHFMSGVWWQMTGCVMRSSPVWAIDKLCVGTCASQQILYWYDFRMTRDGSAIK